MPTPAACSLKATPAATDHVERGRPTTLSALDAHADPTLNTNLFALRGKLKSMSPRKGGNLKRTVPRPIRFILMICTVPCAHAEEHTVLSLSACSDCKQPTGLDATTQFQ